MKILVLNCGSSSIKYRLFEDEELLITGLIERISEKNSKIKSYKQGIGLMLKQLIESKKIKDLSEIKAIGHRVVHGGEISKSCIINKKIIDIINKFSSLAPLHNPANLKGIVEMQKVFPKIPQVAVFDTAFHVGLPDYASIYALPLEFYHKHNIKRYGFHGISYQYISEKAAHMLKKPLSQLNLIICHLGAGCSIAAVKKGKCIDTSMGMTPLEGLVMGTRCGDIDPGILLHLLEQMKIPQKELNCLLNQKSGLTGISGAGNDMREILKRYSRGDKKCKLALEIFSYRIKKYIAAYAAALGKVDAVIFTAGIGENTPIIRAWSANIECLGMRIDDKMNKRTVAKERIISSSNSKIKVLVIPTNEARMIARKTSQLLK